jgi:Cellulase (glycosyl hydrolase family 5)
MTILHCLLVLACLAVCCNLVSGAETPHRWSAQQANDWYAKQPWLVGCNFMPSNAINQLEMWQPESFDLATIDRELALARGLGFNTVRVFLHDLLWEQDAKGLLDRVDQFLGVADKHGIGVMVVLFDGVWDPQPKLGKQREPKPHTHNSGWVQSPSRDVLKDPARHESLAPYVKGVIGRFKDDRRVQVWDIYNEPDNTNVNAYGANSKAKTELPDEQKKAMSLALITKAFGWAREVNPAQPITSGVWAGSWKTIAEMSPMTRFCVEQSDVITFHNYTGLDELKPRVEALRQFNRPLLCTEYMARPVGSTFEAILPYFKEQRIAAYNWGFVDGKSQTIYPWDSWRQQYTAEPPVWFHDIFRRDGTPYREEEVKLIRSLTGAK